MVFGNSPKIASAFREYNLKELVSITTDVALALFFGYLIFFSLFQTQSAKKNCLMCLLPKWFKRAYIAYVWNFAYFIIRTVTEERKCRVKTSLLLGN